MVKSLRLEMPFYLIEPYAELSIAQAHYVEKYPGVKYPGFKHNFALLSINAAIVEGTLRSLLHWYLVAQAERTTRSGIQRGQTEPDLAERLLTKLRIEVDTTDTWSKLKANFKYLFGKSVADAVTKPVLAEIEHLFTIRNRAAHGSSIQLPSTPIKRDEDEYLYALQHKLAELSKYLQATFGVSDIYEGLGHRDVPAKFWITTQAFFQAMSGLYPYPGDLQKNLDAIRTYTFGKMLLD